MSDLDSKIDKLTDAFNKFAIKTTADVTRLQTESRINSKRAGAISGGLIALIVAVLVGYLTRYWK